MNHIGSTLEKAKLNLTPIGYEFISIQKGYPFEPRSHDETYELIIPNDGTYEFMYPT